MSHKSEFDAFNRDVAIRGGYSYTTNASLSSRLANQRLTDVALEIVNFRGQMVIDIGCGDGTYTLELYDRGQPAGMHGVEPAQKAIEIARQRIAGRQIHFGVHSAYELPHAANSFDVAHLRGVLHHLDRPVDALREAFRVARTLVVIEPNGYNPMLKILERFSRYHIEHNEKSYAPLTLDRWISRLGGAVRVRRWVGLVPFFCPDWMARSLKAIEPVVEQLPLINAIGCAQYVFVATRADGIRISTPADGNGTFAKD